MTAALADTFFQRGWVAFDTDAAIADWVARVRPVADRLLADPAHRAAWLRCGGTWFAGVNILPNTPDGSVDEAGAPALDGSPIRFAADVLGLSGFAWDKAQVSVCLPGYPQPWAGESEAAFRFRRNRDAAHVDGLLRDAERRRSLGEVHGFILGLPLNAADPGAAPMVVYEGSHEIMRAALRDRFAGIAPQDWAAEDITDAYTAARRHCFDVCPRVPVHVLPGQAYIVHRLALHGVAPWTAGTDARIIAYFRPDPFPGALPDWWLDRP